MRRTSFTTAAVGSTVGSSNNWIDGVGYNLWIGAEGEPTMCRYLRSVTQGLGWFVTTGQPVSANQFGSHRWFS